MNRPILGLAALLCSSALAGEGVSPAQALSTFRVPYSDTHALHCQSGRSVLYFATNTQFVRLFYLGKVSVLSALNPPAVQNDYSDVGLSGMGQFDTPKLGPGLEWRSTVTSGSMWKRSGLYRVVQHPDGKRTLTLLERCRG
ncbi:hypothetical protein Q0M94_00295 [Deinococcus radiomollis]|uniref:hypothetical protein n=1 Tax=Deinococcus radiomollis TaxID=468916 RepID=UPI003891ADBE